MKLTFRNTRAKGSHSEQVAVDYLIKQGLTLVEQNTHSRYGEIDIIMREGEEWVFIEVRYRKTLHFGGGLESVNHSKQQKLIKTAEIYMQKHHKIEFKTCRFDIIELSGEITKAKINWIQNAFSA